MIACVITTFYQAEKESRREQVEMKNINSVNLDGNNKRINFKFTTKTLPIYLIY